MSLQLNQLCRKWPNFESRACAACCDRRRHIRRRSTHFPQTPVKEHSSFAFNPSQAICWKRKSSTTYIIVFQARARFPSTPRRRLPVSCAASSGSALRSTLVVVAIAVVVALARKEALHALPEVSVQLLRAVRVLCKHNNEIIYSFIFLSKYVADFNFNGQWRLAVEGRRGGELSYRCRLR